jgi:hypothetical protein|nr:MAG TPA: hypothetical protein [Caudoviricetes sp.]
MVKKIVIEFEAGNDSKVADRVFESAIKYTRKSGGRIVNMRTEDVEPEIRVERRRKDFPIPDLNKNREQERLRKVINAYKVEKGIDGGKKAKALQL